MKTKNIRSENEAAVVAAPRSKRSGKRAGDGDAARRGVCFGSRHQTIPEGARRHRFVVVRSGEGDVRPQQEGEIEATRYE